MDLDSVRRIFLLEVARRSLHAPWEAALLSLGSHPPAGNKWTRGMNEA